VGACWDIGHAVWNHRRFGSDEQPADPLLARIAHVHCHDVGRPADGQAAAPGSAGEPDGGDTEVDHRPPRRGAAPWRTFVQRLAAAGYARTVIIEVGPPTFLTCGGLPAVKESIAAVQEAAAVTR
jgi:sugar phosphate isomerase/epimerase